MSEENKSDPPGVDSTPALDQSKPDTPKVNNLPATEPATLEAEAVDSVVAAEPQPAIIPEAKEATDATANVPEAQPAAQDAQQCSEEVAALPLTAATTPVLDGPSESLAVPVEQQQQPSIETPTVQQPLLTEQPAAVTPQSPTPNPSAARSNPILGESLDQGITQPKTPIGNTSVFSLSQRILPEIASTPKGDSPNVSTILSDKSIIHPPTVDFQANLVTAAKFLSLNSSFIENLPQPVIQTIAAQAVKYESLKSQKLFDQVSYEQSVNSNKNKLKTLRQQLDSTLLESQSLRTQLIETQTLKANLEREFLNAKTSSVTLNEELNATQARFTTATGEKRQFLESINQKTNEIKDLQSDRERLRKAEVETRKSLITLEAQLQQFRSSDISSKMREQNQQQEIKLLKTNGEWLEKELKTKSDDLNTFRSEKLSLISNMQSHLSTVQASYQTLKKSHDTLKTQFSDTSKRLDDALVKIKDLQDSQTTNEESFRIEMSSQKRLAELWERSAKDAKKRVEDAETHLDTLRKRETDEINKWKALAEKEKSRADALTRQISSLEGQLETTFVQSEQPGIPHTPLTKSTPIGSPSVSFSPSAKIITEIQKGGGSLVQLYTDYQESQNRLARERHKNQTLREQMNSILEEMENHAPAILAEREENRRLEGELAELSLQLENSLNNADAVSEKLKFAEVKAQDHEKESNLLSKQVTDLSRQIRHLLIQNDLLSHPNNPVSPEEQAALQKLLHSPDSSDDSDTNKLISQRLVLFKNSLDLQKQNANLLKITRELGQRMEEKENEMKRRLEDVESVAVTEAKEAIETLQGEIASINTKLGAVTRERDMFRRMLSNKTENGVSLAEIAESSPEGQLTSQTNHLIKQNQELTAHLRDVETDFANNRTEAAATIKSLDEKNAALINERSNLQIQLAKLESQLELTTERQSHFSSNIDSLRVENEEFKKRSRSLEDSLAKQEMRAQKLSEDLLASSSTLDFTKNENANLKAEKTILKSIEERLSKENSELVEERGRLSALLANTQSMEAERASTSAELTDRLNNQINALEGELTTLRKKLETQSDEIKNLTLLKETETQNYHKRIDLLSTELGQVRQSLTNANSEHEKLQQTYNATKADLATAQERIKNLETASTPDSKSREYAITQQANALKSKLDLAKTELDLSKKSLEDLRGVATAAETALNEMNNTHDAYKASMDKQISEKDAALSDHKKKLLQTTEILTKTKETYSQLDEQRVKRIQTLTEEQTRLQGLVTVLQANETKTKSDFEKMKADLAQQSGITSEARQNYEQELLKHAEAANSLKDLRVEYATLKDQVTELRNAAETAAEKLSSSESSWQSQKYSYEQEIEQIKSRFDETTTQNKLLLDQLESANNRLTDGPPSYDDATAADSQLRELVNHLKREKEIVDVKYELNLQEFKRLKQKLDHVTASLDDSRLKLERLTEDQKKKENSEDAQKVQDQLNDISILRESNTTLRHQSGFYAKKAKDLEGELETLRTRIEPLEAQLRESKAEIEAKEAQVKLVQKEADDWKARTNSILHKYERIDPKVVSDLKEENEKLKKEIDVNTQSLHTSSQKVAISNANIQKLTEELAKATTDLQTTKDELATNTTKLSSLNEEHDETKKKLEAMNARFSKMRVEFIEKLKRNRASNAADKETREKEVAEKQAEIESLRAERDTLKAQLDDPNTLAAQAPQNSEELIAIKTELTSAKEALDAKEAEIAILKKASIDEAKPVDEAVIEKNKRIKDLEEEVNKLSDQILDLQQTVSRQRLASSNGSELAALQEANTQLTSKIEALNSASSIPRTEHEQLLAKQKAEFESNLAKVTADSKKDAQNELEAKVKQIQESAKRKVNELVQKKMSEQEKAISSQGPPQVLSGDESVKKLQEELKTLNEEFASERKKIRERVLKESEMRGRLLQSKSDKVEKERNLLAEEVKTLKSQLEARSNGQQATPAPQTQEPQERPQQQQQAAPQIPPSQIPVQKTFQNPFQNPFQIPSMPFGQPFVPKAQEASLIPTVTGNGGITAIPTGPSITAGNSQIPMAQRNAQGSRLPTRTGLGRGNLNRKSPPLNPFAQTVNGTSNAVELAPVSSATISDSVFAPAVAAPVTAAPATAAIPVAPAATAAPSSPAVVAPAAEVTVTSAPPTAPVVTAVPVAPAVAPATAAPEQLTAPTLVVSGTKRPIDSEQQSPGNPQQDLKRRKEHEGTASPAPSEEPSDAEVAAASANTTNRNRGKGKGKRRHGRRKAHGHDGDDSDADVMILE